MFDQDARIILVACDAAESEIRSLVAKTAKIARDSNRPFYLAIDGYDSDPREIWQIPEAVALCKRMAQHGMMSSLDPGKLPETRKLPGFTALQLWSISTGRIAPDGTCEVTKETYDLFIQDLLKSNATAEGIPPDDGEVFMLKS
jgi:hypothetical protein